jgi:glycosyltransferase involved in cell wall biosynthesis
VNLCVIIPAYNEERTIAETVNEYKGAFPKAHIVVVDNNSTDSTNAAARQALDPERDFLLLERRKGKGYAIKRALSRISADVYLLTDADATYPAKDARRLVDEILKLRFDMLIGDRVSSGTYDAQNTRPGHGWGNRLLTAVISKLAGQSYRDVLSGLRVMSRPFVRAVDVRSTGFQLETEMNVIGAYLRADMLEIPIDYRRRPKGSHSKLSTIRDGVRIVNFALINWIAFAPLQPFLFLAIATMLAACVLGFRVIAGFLETGWPYTTTATAATAAGIISILALFHGITLRILIRNDRRKEIARFLEAKREWNAKLDAESI